MTNFFSFLSEIRPKIILKKFLFFNLYKSHCNNFKFVYKHNVNSQVCSFSHMQQSGIFATPYKNFFYSDWWLAPTTKSYQNKKKTRSNTKIQTFNFKDTLKSNQNINHHFIDFFKLNRVVFLINKNKSSDLKTSDLLKSKILTNKNALFGLDESDSSKKKSQFNQFYFFSVLNPGFTKSLTPMLSIKNSHLAFNLNYTKSQGIKKKMPSDFFSAKKMTYPKNYFFQRSFLSKDTASKETVSKETASFLSKETASFLSKETVSFLSKANVSVLKTKGDKSYLKKSKAISLAPVSKVDLSKVDISAEVSCDKMLFYKYAFKKNTKIKNGRPNACLPPYVNDLHLLKHFFLPQQICFFLTRIKALVKVENKKALCSLDLDAVSFWSKSKESFFWTKTTGITSKSTTSKGTPSKGTPSKGTPSKGTTSKGTTSLAAVFSLWPSDFFSSKIKAANFFWSSKKTLRQNKDGLHSSFSEGNDVFFRRRKKTTAAGIKIYNQLRADLIYDNNFNWFVFFFFDRKKTPEFFFGRRKKTNKLNLELQDVEAKTSISKLFTKLQPGAANSVLSFWGFAFVVFVYILKLQKPFLNLPFYTNFVNNPFTTEYITNLNQSQKQNSNKSYGLGDFRYKRIDKPFLNNTNNLKLRTWLRYDNLLTLTNKLQPKLFFFYQHMLMQPLIKSHFFGLLRNNKPKWIIFEQSKTAETGSKLKKTSLNGLSKYKLNINESNIFGLGGRKKNICKLFFGKKTFDEKKHSTKKKPFCRRVFFEDQNLLTNINRINNIYINHIQKKTVLGHGCKISLFFTSRNSDLLKQKICNLNSNSTKQFDSIFADLFLKQWLKLKPGFGVYTKKKKNIWWCANNHMFRSSLVSLLSSLDNRFNAADQYMFGYILINNLMQTESKLPLRNNFVLNNAKLKIKLLTNWLQLNKIKPSIILKSVATSKLTETSLVFSPFSCSNLNNKKAVFTNKPKPVKPIVHLSIVPVLLTTQNSNSVYKTNKFSFFQTKKNTKPLHNAVFLQPCFTKINGVPADLDGVPLDGVPLDGVPLDGVPLDGVPLDMLNQKMHGVVSSTEKKQKAIDLFFFQKTADLQRGVPLEKLNKNNFVFNTTPKYVSNSFSSKSNSKGLTTLGVPLDFYGVPADCFKNDGIPLDKSKEDVVLLDVVPLGKSKKDVVPLDKSSFVFFNSKNRFDSENKSFSNLKQFNVPNICFESNYKVNSLILGTENNQVINWARHTLNKLWLIASKYKLVLVFEEKKKTQPYRHFLELVSKKQSHEMSLDSMISLKDINEHPFLWLLEKNKEFFLNIQAKFLQNLFCKTKIYNIIKLKHTDAFSKLPMGLQYKSMMGLMDPGITKQIKFGLAKINNNVLTIPLDLSRDATSPLDLSFGHKFGLNYNKRLLGFLSNKKKEKKPFRSFTILINHKKFYKKKNKSLSVYQNRLLELKEFRSKKQNLETRRQQKRKRFYPRPNWLRIRLNERLLIRSNKLATQMAKTNGVNKLFVGAYTKKHNIPFDLLFSKITKTLHGVVEKKHSTEKNQKAIDQKTADCFSQWPSVFFPKDGVPLDMKNKAVFYRPRTKLNTIKTKTFVRRKRQGNAFFCMADNLFKQNHFVDLVEKKKLNVQHSFCPPQTPYKDASSFFNYDVLHNGTLTSEAEKQKNFWIWFFNTFNSLAFFNFFSPNDLSMLRVFWCLNRTYACSSNLAFFDLTASQNQTWLNRSINNRTTQLATPWSNEIYEGFPNLVTGNRQPVTGHTQKQLFSVVEKTQFKDNPFNLFCSDNNINLIHLKAEKNIQKQNIKNSLFEDFKKNLPNATDVPINQNQTLFLSRSRNFIWADQKIRNQSKNNSTKFLIRRVLSEITNRTNAICFNLNQQFFSQWPSEKLRRFSGLPNYPFLSKTKKQNLINSVKNSNLLIYRRKQYKLNYLGNFTVIPKKFLFCFDGSLLQNRTDSEKNLEGKFALLKKFLCLQATESVQNQKTLLAAFLKTAANDSFFCKTAVSQCSGVFFPSDLDQTLKRLTILDSNKDHNLPNLSKLHKVLLLNLNKKQLNMEAQSNSTFWWRYLYALNKYKMGSFNRSNSKKNDLDLDSNKNVYFINKVPLDTIWFFLCKKKYDSSFYNSNNKNFFCFVEFLKKNNKLQKLKSKISLNFYNGNVVLEKKHSTEKKHSFWKKESTEKKHSFWKKESTEKKHSTEKKQKAIDKKPTDLDYTGNVVFSSTEKKHSFWKKESTEKKQKAIDLFFFQKPADLDIVPADLNKSKSAETASKDMMVKPLLQGGSENKKNLSSCFKFLLGKPSIMSNKVINARLLKKNLKATWFAEKSFVFVPKRISTYAIKKNSLQFCFSQKANTYARNLGFYGCFAEKGFFLPQTIKDLKNPIFSHADNEVCLQLKYKNTLALANKSNFVFGYVGNRKQIKPEILNLTTIVFFIQTLFITTLCFHFCCLLALFQISQIRCVNKVFLILIYKFINSYLQTLHSIYLLTCQSLTKLINKQPVPVTPKNFNFAEQSTNFTLRSQQNHLSNKKTQMQTNRFFVLNSIDAVPADCFKNQKDGVLEKKHSTEKKHSFWKKESTEKKHSFWKKESTEKKQKAIDQKTADCFSQWPSEKVGVPLDGVSLDLFALKKANSTSGSDLWLSALLKKKPLDLDKHVKKGLIFSSKRKSLFFGPKETKQTKQNYLKGLLTLLTFQKETSSFSFLPNLKATWFAEKSFFFFRRKRGQVKKGSFIRLHATNSVVDKKKKKTNLLDFMFFFRKDPNSKKKEEGISDLLLQQQTIYVSLQKRILNQITFSSDQRQFFFNDYKGTPFIFYLWYFFVNSQKKKTVSFFLTQFKPTPFVFCLNGLSLDLNQSKDKKLVTSVFGLKETKETKETKQTKQTSSYNLLQNLKATWFAEKSFLATNHKKKKTFLAFLAATNNANNAKNANNYSLFSASFLPTDSKKKTAALSFFDFFYGCFAEKGFFLQQTINKQLSGCANIQKKRMCKYCKLVSFFSFKKKKPVYSLFKEQIALVLIRPPKKFNVQSINLLPIKTAFWFLGQFNKINMLKCLNTTMFLNGIINYSVNSQNWLKNTGFIWSQNKYGLHKKAVSLDSKYNYNNTKTAITKYGSFNASAEEGHVPTLDLIRSALLEKKAQLPSTLFVYPESVLGKKTFVFSFINYYGIKKRKKEKKHSFWSEGKTESTKKKTLDLDKLNILHSKLITSSDLTYKNKLTPTKLTEANLLFYQILKFNSKIFNLYRLTSVRLLLNLLDLFELWFRAICLFFEKPAQQALDWIAYTFLVELCSDFTSIIAENMDLRLWNWFLITVQNTTSLKPAFILKKFAQRRFFSFFYLTLKTLNQPDSDLINRKKKATLFWQLCTQLLIKKASGDALSTSPQTLVDNLLYDNEPDLSIYIQQNQALCKSPPKKKAVYTKNFKESKHMVVCKQPLNALNNKSGFFNSVTNYNEQKTSHAYHINASLPETIYKVALTNKYSDHNFNYETNNFIKNMRNHVNQSVCYEQKNTDMFIDLNLSKSFSHLSTIKYMSQIHQPIGFITCQIYSGILYKQIAKNVLVIGSINAEKSLLIQALAGETEIKIITHNANRYININQGFKNAVGLKLLKDVFDAIVLQTPCLFLLQDVHVIAQPRSLLISESGNAKIILNNQIPTANAEALEVHEKNQVMIQYNKQAMTLYKKPYKSEFSQIIAANAYSFEFFMRSSSYDLSNAKDKKALWLLKKQPVTKKQLFLLHPHNSSDNSFYESFKATNNKLTQFYRSKSISLSSPIHIKCMTKTISNAHTLSNPLKNPVFSLTEFSKKQNNNVDRLFYNLGVCDKSRVYVAAHTNLCDLDRKLIVQKKKSKEDKSLEKKTPALTTLGVPADCFSQRPSVFFPSGPKHAVPADCFKKHGVPLDFNKSSFLQNLQATWFAEKSFLATNHKKKKKKPSLFSANQKLFCHTNYKKSQPVVFPKTVYTKKSKTTKSLGFDSKITANVKTIKPKKLLKNLAFWPEKQITLLAKSDYSVRVKTALLADLAMNNFSTKLDMITDLLIIIDNVRSNKGFVMFATTHTAYKLDPALRRPGRLDETIRVPVVCNFSQRWQILKSKISMFLESEQTYLNPNKSVSLDFSDFTSLKLLTDINLCNYADQHTHNLTPYLARNQSDVVSFDSGSNSDSDSDKQNTRSLYFNALHKALLMHLQKKRRPIQLVTYGQAGKNFMSQNFFNVNQNLKGLHLNKQGLRHFKNNQQGLRQAFNFSYVINLVTGLCGWKENRSKRALFIYLLKKKHLDIKKQKQHNPYFVADVFGSLSAQQNKHNNNNFLIKKAVHHNYDWLKFILNQNAKKHTNGFDLLTFERCKYISIYQHKSLLQKNLIDLFASKVAETLVPFKNASVVLFYKKNTSALFALEDLRFLRTPLEKSAAVIEQRFGLPHTSNNLLPIAVSGLPTFFFFSLFNDIRINKRKKEKNQKLSSFFKLHNHMYSSKEGKELKKKETVPGSKSKSTPCFFNKQTYFNNMTTRHEWKKAYALVQLFLQKRYAYKKSQIITQLISFANSTSFFEFKDDVSNPPNSTIYTPSKMYENYKKIFAMQEKKVKLSLTQKLGKHQQQRFLKNLYKVPFVQWFKSHFNKTKMMSFEKSCMFLTAQKGTNLYSVSSMSWYYNNTIMKRHVYYITNQWFNAQLEEHNAQTVFLSDVDSRYTYIQNLGDLIIDFPDTDQLYNPRRRKWLLNCTSMAKSVPNKLQIQNTSQQISNNLLISIFNQVYMVLSKNRDQLDSVSYKFLKTGGLKQYDLLVVQQ